MSAFGSPSPTEPLSLVTVLVGRLTHVTRHSKSCLLSSRSRKVKSRPCAQPPCSPTEPASPGSAAITRNRVTTQSPASQHACCTSRKQQGATLMRSLTCWFTVTGSGLTSSTRTSVTTPSSAITGVAPIRTRDPRAAGPSRGIVEPARRVLMAHANRACQNGRAGSPIDWKRRDAARAAKGWRPGCSHMLPRQKPLRK